MPNRDYDRIARAITYLDRHAETQPGLAEVARAAGLSEFHFQRLFRRWAGVSPKRFLQHLTAGRAKSALGAGRSVLEATYDAGLSGPGRLHDLLVAVDAVTPGEFKTAGVGLIIQYGVHQTPFGDCLIAATPRGICALEFVEPGTRRDAVARLRDAWRGADLREAPQATAPYAARIFHPAGDDRPLTLFLRGTNFQLKVWEALLHIPEGTTVTYGDLARLTGTPRGARAIGTAVARNPIAYVIPCHRVIRATGAVGGYRWGPGRKRAMLAWEQARTGT